jgi:hypothetical protein
MPRVRRRGPNRRGDFKTSDRVIFKLMRGGDFRFLDPIDVDLGRTLDEDLLRQTWQEMGQQLLQEYVFDGWDIGEEVRHHEPRPGCRPWGWWRFEATEPRRKFYEVVQLSDGPCEIPQVESDFDYLDRLGLLLPGELAAVESLERGKQPLETD